MLHHVDIHVRDIEPACALVDALAPFIGYRRVVASGELEEPGFVGYEPITGGRPRFGLIPDAANRAGSMRLAFAVGSREEVDAAAARARTAGARAVDGPAVHPEYGDYYAVFFEDRDGNKYEIAADKEALSARSAL